MRPGVYHYGSCTAYLTWQRVHIMEIQIFQTFTAAKFNREISLKFERVVLVTQSQSHKLNVDWSVTRAGLTKLKGSLRK